MSITPAHVLVVDDDADLLQSYLRLLASHGYTVEGAEDGMDALARLSLRRFDVVLTDVHMPRLGGLDVLSGIRTRDLDVPVVLMTADPDVRSAVVAVEEGAVGYLIKPLTRTSLLPTLEKAVRLGALGRAKKAALELIGNEGHLVGDRAGVRVVFDRALSSLYPVFQPIVDHQARKVIAYEALMRSGEALLPGPNDVIAAAERLDRIFDLGRVMRAKIAESEPVLPLGCDLYVNVHPHELLDENLYDSKAPLSKVAPRTVLEITERATLDNITDIEGRVSRLRLMGFRLAIDDLGAGYAGLSSLVQLQPDVVKLDMSLIRNVDHDPARQRVVGALIDLSERLDLAVICEGVETTGERDFLHLIGGRWQQGYLYARPAREAPAMAWD